MTRSLGPIDVDAIIGTSQSEEAAERGLDVRSMKALLVRLMRLGYSKFEALAFVAGVNSTILGLGVEHELDESRGDV